MFQDQGIFLTYHGCKFLEDLLQNSGPSNYALWKTTPFKVSDHYSTVKSVATIPGISMCDKLRVSPLINRTFRPKNNLWGGEDLVLSYDALRDKIN